MQMASPDASNLTAGDATIDAALKHWTGQLIDLSRRNNLLFFKDLKTGTLDLVLQGHLHDPEFFDLRGCSPRRCRDQGSVPVVLRGPPPSPPRGVVVGCRFGGRLPQGLGVRRSTATTCYA